MDRQTLFEQLAQADLEPGDLIYIERRGDSYGWKRGGSIPWQEDGSRPDVWIFYTWQGRVGADTGAVLDDLMAEMESMQGGADRCRWPLDRPWPWH